MNEEKTEASPLSLPDDREKRMLELKKRLKEVEELRRQLGIPAQSSLEKEEQETRHSISDVREAIEEIEVPPLEMLDDRPFPKKKKQAGERAEGQRAL